MSTRAHLLDSDEPLMAGENYTALCGAEVKNAQFACAFDDELIGGLFSEFLADNSSRFCRRCQMLEIEKRCVYALVDGETAKQGEPEP